MDHQKSSPNPTTLYQVAVVVLLVGCFSVLVALFLRTDPRAEYRAAQQEYLNAILIVDKIDETLDSLRGNEFANETVSELKSKLSNAKKRVAKASECLGQFN